MHELGIIVHISRTLEEVAKENQLTEIGSVTLEIGEVSGVVPEYMTDCWKYYRRKSELLEESELKIEIRPRGNLLRSLPENLSHGSVWQTMPRLRQLGNEPVNGK